MEETHENRTISYEENCHKITTALSETHEIRAISSEENHHRITTAAVDSHTIRAVSAGNSCHKITTAMADSHERAVSYDENYHTKEVVFYIGMDLPSPDCSSESHAAPLAAQADLPSVLEPSRVNPATGEAATSTADVISSLDAMSVATNLSTEESSKVGIAEEQTKLAEEPERNNAHDQVLVNGDDENAAQPDSLTEPEMTVTKNSPTETVEAVLSHDETEIKSGGSEMESLPHSSSNNNDVTTLNQEVKKGAQSSNERIMEEYHMCEQSFSNAFFTPEIKSLSEKAASRLSPAQTAAQASGVDPLESLDLLVKMLHQLTSLQGANVKLQRKCSFLEDTRSLLYVQNQNLLETAPHGKHKSRKYHTTMQYLTPPAGGSASRQSLERLHSSDEGKSKSDFSLSQESLSPPALQRSQSEGSIDMIDLDLTDCNSQVEEKNTRQEEFRISRTSVYKKSKKLKAKWKQMKKVFTGLQEPGPKSDVGAVSAEQLVQANKKHHHNNKPSILPHVKSENGETILLDTLMNNAPELVEPSTPSSVQSEPPCRVEELESSDGSGVNGTQLVTTPLRAARSTSSMYSDEGVEVRATFSFKSEEDRSNNQDPVFVNTDSPSIVRRRSSPILGHSDFDRDLISLPVTTSSPRLVRSSSYRVSTPRTAGETERQGSRSSPVSPSRDATLTQLAALKSASNDAAKKAREAWSKVKDIIQTRKDSLKRRQANKRTVSGGDTATDDGETSPVMSSPDEKYRFDLSSFEETEVVQKTDKLKVDTATSTPRLGRKSKSAKKGLSPVRGRSSPRGKSPLGSPSRHKKRMSLANVVSGSPPIDVSALMGAGLTDDFHKKMQEWEDKKKKSMVKSNSFSCEAGTGVQRAQALDDSSTKFTEDFIKKMDEWEQIKGLASSPSRQKLTVRHETICDPSTRAITPPLSKETLRASPSGQENLSQSFSKTVQEFERIKEQYSHRGSSPAGDGRSRSKKDKDTGGKSREREKSRQRYEKEIQKIEKREQKIEREKRKLEQMKMKLDLQMESSSGSSVGGGGGGADGAAGDYKKKLDEWEGMHGSPENAQVVPAAVEFSSKHMRSQSIRVEREVVSHPTPRERILSDSAIQPLPLPLPPEHTEAHHNASLQTTMDEQLVNFRRKMLSESTSIDGDFGTDSFDDQQRDYQDQIQVKDEEISLLHDDMMQLTDRINDSEKEHTQKLAHLKRELWATSRIGRYTIAADLAGAAIKEFQEQLHKIQIICTQLKADKEKLLAEKHARMSSRGEIDHQVVEETKRLQALLVQQGGGAHMGVVVNMLQFMHQAQEQLGLLQQAITDRNRLLEEMERHLMVQEVTNKLTCAEMQRGTLERRFLRDRHKRGIIRRTQSFTGLDVSVREGSVEVVPVFSSFVQPQSLKAVCSKAKSCLLSSIGSPSSLHLQLLDSLRQQIETEVEQRSVEVQVDMAPVPTPSPPPPAAPPEVHPEQATASVQTIMTLCNYSYIPKGYAPDSADHLPLVISRGVQTVDEPTPISPEQPASDSSKGVVAGNKATSSKSQHGKSPKQSSQESKSTDVLRQDKARSSFLSNSDKFSVKRVVRKQYAVDIDELYSPGSSQRSKSISSAAPSSDKKLGNLRKCSLQADIKKSVKKGDANKNPESAEVMILTAIDNLAQMNSDEEKPSDSKSKASKEREDSLEKSGSHDEDVKALPREDSFTKASKKQDDPCARVSNVPDSPPRTFLPINTALDDNDVNNTAANETSTHSSDAKKALSFEENKSIEKYEKIKAMYIASSNKENASPPTADRQTRKGEREAMVSETLVLDLESEPQIDLQELRTDPPNVGSHSQCRTQEVSSPNSSQDHGKSAKTHGEVEKLQPSSAASPVKLSDGKTLPEPTSKTPNARHLADGRQKSTKLMNGGDKPLGGLSESLAQAQLPHSPIIRSKYTRKLKSMDLKSQPMHVESRLWNATPPRRVIRHRKISLERVPYCNYNISAFSEDEDPTSENCEPMRGRTKSDTSIFNQNYTKGTSIASKSNAAKAQYLVTDTRDCLGSGHEAFVRNGNFRKSPSPSITKVSVAAAMRLKSAAELLQDSLDQHGHIKSLRDADCVLRQTREKLPSTSSDKENEKVMATSWSGYPDRPRQTDSNESFYDNQMSTPTDNSLTSLHVKPPLQDLTNGGGVKAPTTDLDADSLTDVSNMEGTSREPSELSDFSTQSGDYENVKPKSVSPLAAKPGSPDRAASRACDDTELSHFPRSKARRQLFTRGQGQDSPKIRAKSTSAVLHRPRPHSGGVISALCMHTVTMSLDGDEALGSKAQGAALHEEQQEGVDRKRTKAKFPGGHWLQKKFFKVSKC